MAHKAVFPFSAIVGQERMKRALILNAVNPQIGGVLIRGERGTAKSTASRALAAVLPEGTSFINLPVSATEDRVVGTLDIEKAIQKGEKHFEAGILYHAHNGILYVDEVNLLDDHVVDLLLDAAAMGVNIVEREGISHSHPARFILVGTMNPEEGDLRPQLLDRFAFSVHIGGLMAMKQRVAIMERRIAFETDPEAFREEWSPKESSLSERIAKARELVNDVKYTRRDLGTIASLTAAMKVDGHRGDIVILRGAQAHAAYMGRDHITQQDILLAAELALPHRMKTSPFEDTGDISDLADKLADAEKEFGESDFEGEAEIDENAPEGEKKTL
ncbi:MAG: ATP-binding protein [Ardenticatenaceae bacterium]|nr:ATP-binding protein [Ardenticatenaceae bacterium]